MTTYPNFIATPNIKYVTVAGASAFGGSNMQSWSGFTVNSCSITNLSGSECQFRLNGLSTATGYLPADTTIQFSPLDGILITSVDFQNNASGATTVDVQIIVGLS